MPNDIVITFTPEQKALIAAYQAQERANAELIKDLRAVAKAGGEAGRSLSGGYRDANRELDRLNKTSQQFKSTSPLDQHLARLKELRVLYRIGKLSIEEFNKARDASHKQWDEASGMKEQIALQQKSAAIAAKNEADRKAAAKSFDLQKKTSIYEQQQAEKSAADQVRRSLQTEQQTARIAFRERMRHIHDLRRAGALSQAEYSAAAGKAMADWRKLSQIDIAAAWRNVPPMITGALTATAALTAAIRLARAEFENLAKRQEEARTSHLTYAESAAPAKQNLDETMTGAQFDEWVMGASKRTGQSPKFIAQAASGVLGAKGNRSAKDALNALEATIPFERFNAAGLKDVAGAALQQQTADKDASFKEILGQQIAAKVASRVESSQSFAEHVTFGAVGARAYGDTSKDWYGITAYLANMGGDPTGQTSGSGGVNWQKQMMQIDMDLKGQGQEQMGGSTIERTRAIAKNPKFKSIQERLIGSKRSELAKELDVSGGVLTARARNYGAELLLLQNDPKAWAEFESTLAKIPELGKDSAAFADKQLQDLKSPQQMVAVHDQTNTAGVERDKLRNTPGARIANARKRLNESLEAAGESSFNQFFHARNFSVNTWLDRTQPEILAAQTLEGSANRFESASTFESLASPRVSPDVAQDYRESAQALREAAAELRAMAAEFANAKQPIQVNMPGGNEKPAPPPAANLGGKF